MAASLAAKRVDNRGTGSVPVGRRPALPGVKSRSARSGSPPERLPEPVQVDGVDPTPATSGRLRPPPAPLRREVPHDRLPELPQGGGAVDRVHSTVTTLARLRGRSTSWPWSRAR